MAVDAKHVKLILDILYNKPDPGAIDKLVASLEKLNTASKKTKKSQNDAQKSIKQTGSSMKSTSASSGAMANAMAKGAGSAARLNNAIRRLGQGVRDADNGFKSFKLTITGMESFFLGQGLAIAAASKGWTLLRESMQEAAKTQGAMIGLAATARYAGEDVGKSLKAASDLASDGFMNITDSALALKNLLAKGYNLEQSIKITERLKESAVFYKQAALTVSEAVVGATEGIKNEMSVKVDNAGVTKNLSIMWKEYAKEVEKGVMSLSEAEKRFAILKGILEETEASVGNLERAQNTLIGRTAAYDKAIIDLKRTLGNQLSPALTSMLKGFTFILREGVIPFLYGIEMLSVKIANFYSKVQVYFNTKITIWDAIFGGGKENAKARAQAEKRFKELDQLMQTEIYKIVQKYEGIFDIESLLGPDTGKRRPPDTQQIEKTASVMAAAITASIEKIKTQLAELKSIYDRGYLTTKEYFDKRKELVTNQYNKEIEGLRKLLDENTKAEKKARIQEKITKKEGELKRQLIKITEDEYLANKRLAEVKQSLSRYYDDVQSRIDDYGYSLEELRVRQENLAASTPNIYRPIAEGIQNIEDKVSNFLTPAVDKAKAALNSLKEGGVLPVGPQVDFNLQRQFLMEQNELERQHSQERLDRLRQMTDAHMTAAQKEIEMEKIKAQQTREYERLITKQKEEEIRARLTMTQTSANLMSGMFGDLNTAFGEHTKAFFLLEKAAAIAEAIINTELAVTKVMGQTGIFGISMATLVRARGMAAVAAIAAQTVQGLAGGGPVQGSSPHPKADNIPIKATAGEFMQPVDTVKYYGIGLMEALRRKAIPKNFFKGMAMPTNIMRPAHAFATGGMVTSPGNTFSVSVPVTINGMSSPERLAGKLQAGLEETVIQILRRELA